MLEASLYTYDAFNRRFRIANASNTIDYRFDAAGQRLVVWQENVNFGIRGNAYWGNTPIAFHGSNGTEYFEQQDWEGTERVRTDYTGAVVRATSRRRSGDGFSASGQMTIHTISPERTAIAKAQPTTRSSASTARLQTPG